jgi:hypothetical protein
MRLHCPLSMEGCERREQMVRSEQRLLASKREDEKKLQHLHAACTGGSAHNRVELAHGPSS